jgi:hypothetical protein
LLDLTTSKNVAPRVAGEKGVVMFTELTEELLDLSATQKGFGGALLAADDGGGGCGACSSALCIIICTLLSHICW